MSKPVGSIICVAGDNHERRRKIKGTYVISESNQLTRSSLSVVNQLESGSFNKLMRSGQIATADNPMNYSVTLDRNYISLLCTIRTTYLLSVPAAGRLATISCFRSFLSAGMRFI